MRNFLQSIYGFVYDWSFPILFLLFVIILVTAGEYNSYTIFTIGCISLIVGTALIIIYLWLFPFEHLGERFELWVRSFKKYKLSPLEYEIWKNIDNKAIEGLNEWNEQTHGDDLCGPWLKGYTKEEGKLIDKIHQYFYGEHWYITMPISNAQCYYQMYYDINDRVTY